MVRDARPKKLPGVCVWRGREREDLPEVRFVAERGMATEALAVSEEYGTATATKISTLEC